MLPVDEAIKAAQERLRSQISDLQEQAETLALFERGRQDKGTKAPRTLRQG